MILFSLLICLNSIHSLEAQKPGLEKFSDLEQIERFLKEAAIVSVEKAMDSGRTEPWIVTLKEGDTIAKAFFKHVNRPRPGIFPDCYKYEIAAYELNKILELNIVSPIVEREIEGSKGSLQLYVEGCILYSSILRQKIKPPDAQKFKNSLDVISIFEHLTYCERKDLDDILVHEQDWKVCRVDFSEAFLPQSHLIPGEDMSRCSEKLYRTLLSLYDAAVAEKLDGWLNKEEINAILARKTIICETLQRLIQERGEEAVLF